MAKVIVTMKLMPESPDVSLAHIEAEAKKVIVSFEGKFQSAEKQPIGFGLVSLIIIFSLDETKGTDDVEAAMCKVDGIESAQTTMTSRALG